MRSNKTLLRALVVIGVVTLSLPIDSIASVLDKHKVIQKEVSLKSITKKSFGKTSKLSGVLSDSVLEVILNEGEFVPSLANNPDKYEVIRVITTGNKKLVKADYDNLRESKIPKVDLSNAYSDSIPAGAFSNATHLTEFNFPKGVKTIDSGSTHDSGAFYNCFNLTGDLIIPDTVTTIRNCAFEGCKGFNGRLIIPSSVTTIGNCAFRECSGLIGDLIIPNSVTTIGNYAFYKCSKLDGNLVISNSVTMIGDYTFRACSKLTGDLVIPDSVKKIGNYAFRECKGFTGNLVIPNSVTTIGSNAFYKCSGLTGDLIIPNSITTIGNSAFYDCTGFTGSLIISDSLTSVGENAFNGCSGFTDTLLIPDSLTSIGISAFNNTYMKIIVKIDESQASVNYRKGVVEKLPINNTYLEMSYNFDYSNTWLEKTKYIKAKPTISTYAGVFENNEGLGVILKIIEASDIKTINILKDGEIYILEKSSGDKYVFTEEGDYQVYIETELGTVSNISFKNNNPIFEPTVEYKGNGVNILGGGCLSSEKISEKFNSIDNLKLNFSNLSWNVENAVLKSESIGNNAKTENEIVFNAEAGDKVQINVKTSSEGNCDWGYVYVNGVQVYKKSGTLNDFEMIEFDLQEGENRIKFVYEKDSVGSSGDDAILIDYIKVLGNKINVVDCDVLEYRINGGEWQVYNGPFELNYPAGTKVEVEVRAKHDGFVSSILLEKIIVESDVKQVESAVEKAELYKDVLDINNARALVNSMPESLKKDEFQNRLNNIFPNLILESKTGTVNLDMYIESKNMLSLSLDTNSVKFDDFSGVESVEKTNAINLTISSSLPYKANVYLASEIKSVNGDNIMNKDILNIKESGSDDYNTFVDIANPIILLDNQPANNNVSHGVDLMLDGNLAYEKDIYKAVVKFEVEQK